MWRKLYNTKWFAVSAGRASRQGGTLSVLRRRLALCLPVFAVASTLWGAQVQTPPQAPPPEKPPEATKTLPNSVSPDNTGAPVDPKTYVIGPEDVLFISVFREPELSGSVGVRPDGKITKPLIGDMQAGGLTPERLGAQLKQAFSSFIKNPDVQVTVAQVNSKRYTIAGEVMRPGPYPLVLPTTVFEALSNVGFRDFANTKKIVIIRGTERIKFNYNDVLKGKHLEQNILLQAGDTIYVK
jgi:polysaccharide export outer membrane protein